MTNKGRKPANPATPAGTVIQSTRLGRALNLRQMAEALGNVSHATLAQYESGDSEPNARVISEWLDHPSTWARVMAQEILTARAAAYVASIRRGQPVDHLPAFMVGG